MLHSTSVQDRLLVGSTGAIATSDPTLLPGVQDTLSVSQSDTTALNSSAIALAEVNLGILAGTSVYGGVVGSQNTSDIYQFDIVNTDIWAITNANFTLSGMSADADLQLIRDSDGDGFLSSGDDWLTGSTQAGDVAEWMSVGLTNGRYFLQVNQYTGDTQYHLTASTGDWFSQNLSDAGVIGETRVSLWDGSISRTEMVGILQETEDYSVVDASEITDLRQVLHSFNNYTPEYVSNLADSVVNGSLANTRSGIGNLFAGSTDTQMSQLIGKWFYGSDRPQIPIVDPATGAIIATGTYEYTSGSLFQDGISFSDVNQGAVGTCYFLSSLAAFASDRPSVIENMFIDNGDGTFTVRFFNQGVAEYVTVDRALPVDADGRLLFAESGAWSGDSSNELWVALAEKAYAQFNETGLTGRSDSSNAYQAMSGGWMIDALQQVAGVSGTAVVVSQITFSTLVALVNANVAITAGFVDGNAANPNIVDKHAYTITSYDPFTGRFHLNNPWGYDHVDVSWQELLGLNAHIDWSHA